MAGRHDQVLAQHKLSVELDPGFFYFDAFAGVAYREKKMWNEAVKVHLLQQRLHPGDVRNSFSNGRIRSHLKEARKLLESMRQTQARRVRLADVWPRGHAAQEPRIEGTERPGTMADGVEPRAARRRPDDVSPCAKERWAAMRPIP